MGACAISVISYLCPGLLQPLRGYIVPLLGLVMLGMGMTLRSADFVNVLRRPGAVTPGVALQCILMPFMAWTVSEALGLPIELAKFPVLAALPGAVFSIWHNISGSVLAAWWGRDQGLGAKDRFDQNIPNP